MSQGVTRPCTLLHMGSALRQLWHPQPKPWREPGLSLLERSSHFRPHSRAAHEDSEHLAGDEPFETAQDLPFREPLLRATGGVGLGLLIPSQSHHGDAVQGGIGLPVAATVQAMAIGFA